MIFTAADAWAGGYYELAMRLDAPHIPAAVDALWSFADLDGCYLDRDREPADQPRIAPSPQHDLLGVARIAGALVACRSLVIEYAADDSWLHFMLPMGSLATVLPVRAYPFGGSADLAWRDALDAWLCTIARHVHVRVPFSIALVGWDVGADQAPPASGEIPDERWIGYLVATDAGLQWLAPNQGAPFSFAR